MLEITQEGEKVFLSGRFDASQSEKAKSVFETLNGPTTVDLGGLEYISSAGISVLLAAFKRLRDSGAPFKLVQVPPRIRTVFQYAGLDRIFVIEEN